MPAKKDDTAPQKEEKAVAPKKAPAKKKPVAKKKAAAPKKAPAKKVVLKKTATATGSKKPLSKGKARKLRVVDVFNGRRYTLGVGKRKSAIALVRMHEKGTGKILVNNKELSDYSFGILIENALQPLVLTGKETAFDISIKVEGGGSTSQAEAIRHGISRALVSDDDTLRPVLKKAGLLTRDARVKERKKPGLKGARRAPQWVKR